MVPSKRISEGADAEEHSKEVMCVSNHSTPKCFKQIGRPDARDHIFMEDYVKSYLEHVGEACVEEGCILAIYGTLRYVGDVREWYLDGAAVLSVTMEDILPDSKQAIRAEIEQIREKYFPEWELCGWLFALPQFLSGETILYEELTRAWFAQQELVFVTYHMFEKELICQLYNGDYLEGLRGYYVYYDKNARMQEYMVEHQWAIQREMPKDRTAEAISLRFRCASEEPGQVETALKVEDIHESNEGAERQLVGKARRRYYHNRAWRPVRQWSILTIVTVVMTTTFVLLLGIFIYTQYDNMDQVVSAVRSFTESISP